MTCALLVLVLVLCRVTPEGSTAVTGSSPTAAWQELYKAAPPIEGMSAKASAGAVAARAASVCGPRLFGLQHPVIAALIESLPDATLCESFLAWKGTPPVPQVTVSETRHSAGAAQRGVSCEVSVNSQLRGRHGSHLDCSSHVPAARCTAAANVSLAFAVLPLRAACCVLCPARALTLCWHGA